MRKQQQQGMAVVLLVAVLAMMMLVPEGARAATATACNAGQLTVCAAAIMGGTKPSAACCSNLRAQKGCFCQYAKNPAYGPYITSPNARRAVASCGISLPRC